MAMHTTAYYRRGFTIVELLIVIVVIGILAAITIVTYNGVQQKAIGASLQSDLVGASAQLKLYQVDNGAYPTTNDCATVPAVAPMICLKTSPGNSFGSSYSPNNSANPQTFTLQATHDTTSYVVTDSTTPVIVASATATINGGLVTTLAGNGSQGSVDGASASFYNPFGTAVDSAGMVYVADSGNSMVRKITPAGLVTTLAGSSPGSADGSGTNASFNYPYGLTVDSSGTVYVADTVNNRIRKITPAGQVTTLAGSARGSANGSGTSASFYFPYGIAVDSTGTVYVADTNNYRIRKITPAGLVTTLAGNGSSGSADGAGASASFYSPYGIAVDAAGMVYVADTGNHKIRQITPAGQVTTLAGSARGSANGSGTSASFNSPSGIAVDSAGTVYVGDAYNYKIRKIK